MDINMNCQLSVFGDFDDISVSSQMMVKLTEAFEEYELIPSTFIENNSVVQQPIIRPRLDTVKNDWKIMIYKKRIDIEQKLNYEEGANVVDIGASFKEKALSILQKILEMFHISLTGLSLNTTSVKCDFNPHIYTKFVTPTAYYSENEPVEWTLRAVARVIWELAGNSNEVNVISILNRDFDTLKIQFDINTAFGSIAQQLDISAIDSFLIQAIETREQLLNDLNANGKLD